jgi:hypothetical protein
VKYLGILLLLAGCNHGNGYMDPVVPDMAEPIVDLAPTPRDLTTPGPSCGEVAMCALGCGQDPTCLGNCVMGVDPATLQTLGGLLLCAGTNCVNFMGGGDGGGLGNIDQTALFMCLFQKCQMQLTACGGLFGNN